MYYFLSYCKSVYLKNYSYQNDLLFKRCCTDSDYFVQFLFKKCLSAHFFQIYSDTPTDAMFSTIILNCFHYIRYSVWSSQC